MKWNLRALAVVLLAITLVLLFQGTRDLWDPDEGRFTNVALQMLRTGDFISLYRHHETLHFTKPPVTYWAIAGSVSLFGWNPWATRLPNALAYLGVVLLLLRIGRHFAPQRPWLPGLVYATLPLPLLAAHLVTTDTLLAFATTLAMAAYVIARFEAKPGWMIVMWAAFGLAFMTKGPPGLVGLLPIALFQWLSPGGPRWVTRAGLGVFALVALPWYLVVIQRHEGLLSYLIGYEVVARIATDTHNRHPEWWGGLYVYGLTFALGALPWWPWAWAAGRRAGWRWSQASEPTRLMVIWLGATLLIFMVSRSRLPLYVLPLFAPLALLIAHQLEGAVLTRGRRVAIAAATATAVCIKLLAASLPALVAHLPPETAARVPLHKNARLWADDLRAMAPSTISEVVFVDDMARYGLHLHLQAEVRKVTFEGDMASKPISDAPFDNLLINALKAPPDPGRLFVMRLSNAARFEAMASASGLKPHRIGERLGRAIYTLAPDPSG